ncbi:MAG TPA: exonuclease domain-containing protein [Gaiellaceae bacterium]|nr:exonuclease domain-containing protein [Gaiellaceae bacterium]
MQLALDAVDRLVEHLEERGAPLPAVAAARFLFASPTLAEGLAHSLVAGVVAGDGRLTWLGGAIALAGGRPDPLLEEAEFVVFDLETTGLSAVSSRICEIGAVRVRALELADEFETLVDPRVPLPGPIERLTGLRSADLRGAPRVAPAVRRFVAFAGGATLAAHNARFDLSFLDRQLELLYGRKRAAPVLDTVALARRLLDGRTRRAGLASLASFFGTSTEPCHRALPDARATAEVLVRLIGLAQERGARTLSDLLALAATRTRRVYGKRALAHGAPPRPGIYVFRDRHGQPLYVGRARDLRARLRSYFRSERQRPAVEAALAAVEEVDWRVLGSELEAGLEELRLIRELRPPANARSVRPDRYVYLRRRGGGIVVTSQSTELGPIRSRRNAELAARALARATEAELESLLRGDAVVHRLRLRLRDLADSLRYEDAARLRDRLSALESVLRHLRTLEALRARELCLVAPATEPGWSRAFFVAAGRVCAVRSLPPGGGARLEAEAGIAEAQAARAAGVSYDRESCDELLLVWSFVRRPPPELAVLPLDAALIAARAA